METGELVALVGLIEHSEGALEQEKDQKANACMFLYLWWLQGPGGPLHLDLKPPQEAQTHTPVPQGVCPHWEQPGVGKKSSASAAVIIGLPSLTQAISPQEEVPEGLTPRRVSTEGALVTCFP